MSVRFDANLANALVNGMPVPIDAVYSFCQDAYDSFNKLNETIKKLEEKEKECSNLSKEVEHIKGALLETEDALNQAQEKLHSIHEQEYQNKLNEAYDK